MNVTTDQLLQLLNIGHDTSRRGAGISLRDALARADFGLIRREVCSADLLPFLKADPGIVKQWLLYCDDKRTNGGYWVSRETFCIGSVEVPDFKLQFDTIEEAVAEYVIRELDFWWRIGGQPVMMTRLAP